MQGTIAVTDHGWYTFLSARPHLTEVNFWTPSARRQFRAEPFSPFLFKLKAPHNAICGFAFFAQYSPLPDWAAWESFEEGNGCASFAAMHERIKGIRARIRYDEATGSDEIGCIQLVQPVFLPPDEWVPQPSDWHPRTQTHVKYDLASGEGRRVWEACRSAAQALSLERTSSQPGVPVESGPRYGAPQLVEPRLGQGTFRIAVLDAYSRSCCVTGEHSLPALEASHIRPYVADGPHEVSNGLLFRADVHRLFDKGYVTVTPDLRLHVSGRLAREFHNGRTYYPFDDTAVQIPKTADLRPSADHLEWHNEHVFLR